jgi:hypothetical protein
MILKDFLELIRHTKLGGKANGQAVNTIELGVSTDYHDRFSIESFNGNKIEKHNFKKIEDIPNNLLQAKLVKWNIDLGVQNNGYDYTTIEFLVIL